MYYFLDVDELGSISPELEQKEGLFEKMESLSFLVWANSYEEFDNKIEKLNQICRQEPEDEWDYNLEISFRELAEMRPKEKEFDSLDRGHFVLKGDIKSVEQVVEKLFDKRNY